MKILLLSDLHLEFSELVLPDDIHDIDLVILSGDITTAKRLNHNFFESKKFFDSLCSRFPQVFYIAGNHEFYNSEWNHTLDTLRNFCKRYHNLTFFDNDSLVLNDYVFVGTTLWTSMDRTSVADKHYIQKSMNDYRVIQYREKRLTCEDTITEHVFSTHFIREVVKAHPEKKVVVMTHHMPTPLSIHPKYKGQTLSAAFASDLSDLILENENIVLWTCGHTHDGHSYRMGKTFVLCNPRGYVTANYEENPAWNPRNGIIDLATFNIHDHEELKVNWF